ncbi:hypothetical protein GGR58DRAFT_497114 [Xylaria digitata]|nr:hypothetical protein GGR58DRAFT_497114 [Xylaria digitata]
MATYNPPTPIFGLGAVSQEELQIEYAAQQWIHEAWYIPKNINYDWRPFCTALIQNHRDVTDISQPPPPPEPPEYIQSSKRAGNTPGRDDEADGGTSDIHFIKIPADKVPSKDPEGGSWEHVVYIPEWMDPDYNENFIRTGGGRWRDNTVRDAVYNLRPALRLEDTIRKPTDYALRFGIAEGRLDGRSRMSPTWSKTRDPMDDFAGQVARLNDAERAQAIDLSRRILAARNQLPIPGQEIIPEAMETMLRDSGLLSNAQLKEEVGKAAMTGVSLDQIVDDLERRNPQIKEAHRVFLQNALDDQDYQRTLLMGISTDEAIQWNSHTMSNDSVTDLDNPIHELFDRSRWLDSRWKGYTQEIPKFAYNIGGTREEWNVVTNDALWAALQPALRLASMVLSKNPPLLEAIYNMNTRQPIPPEFDGRSSKPTPTLTKFVRVEDIDMSKTYPEIYQLSVIHGYDWKSNVMRHLRDVLEFDIGSAYNQSYFYTFPPKEQLQQDPFNTFTLGCSGLIDEGDDRKIRIKLGAEMIWPLLVPQYSASEKMTVSFTIASTLLHEFAHTVSLAQFRLCTEESAQPEGQDPEVTRLLFNLQGSLFDWDYTWEPYFGDNPVNELGRDMEDSLWGFERFTSGQIGNRNHRGVWFVNTIQSYPYTLPDPRLGTVRPWAIYHRPIALESIERLFRKSFWEEDFETYGFSILKMTPDNRIRKNLRPLPNTVEQDLLVANYGEQQAMFLLAVPEILSHSRHFVLSLYLRAVALETLQRQQYDMWWQREAIDWQSEICYPFAKNVRLLGEEIKEGRDYINKLFVDDWRYHYAEWYNAQDPTNPNLMTDDVWHAELCGNWYDMFRDGGRIMQRLLLVHNYMQHDLGILQRMVFYYRTNRSLGVIYKFTGAAAADTTEGALYTRLDFSRRGAKSTAGIVGGIASLSAVSDYKEKWEQWQGRFESTEKQYEEMQAVLDEISRGGRIEPFDIPAKVRFDRLPTGEWKPLSDRYKKMATHEYDRAPMAVRNTIDEYFEILQSTVRIRAPGATSIGRLGGKLFQSLQGIGAELGDSVSSLFDVNIPALDPTIDPALLLAPPQTELPGVATTQPTSTLPPGGSVPFTFGVPGGPVKTQGSSDGGRPRRVLGAYQRYDKNLLVTPQSSGEASNLFAVPQPLPHLSPGRKQLVRGSGQNSYQLFPNPFASRVVMTSDVIAFQEQQRLAEQAATMANQAAGAYRTPRMWREKRKNASDSDSEGDGDS